MVFKFIARALCCCCTKVPKCTNPLPENLNNLEYHDTKVWLPPIKKMKCIKVCDGDTIVGGCYIYGTAFRFRIRIARCDAPELHPNVYKNARQKEYEIQAAILSKQAVANICLGKIITLSNVKTEKWGRLLAEVKVNESGINISDYLLKHGLAVPYSGGTKEPINYKNFPFAKNKRLYRKLKKQIIKQQI